MLDTIYNEIEAHLRALDATLDAAGMFGKLGTIALYTGQYVNQANHNAIKRPAALIEFATINYADYNEGGQSGEMLVRIHIVMDSLTVLQDNSRDKAKALWLLKYPQLVHQGLQNKSGTNFNGLLRRSDASDANPDNLYVHVITYTANVKDMSTSRKGKYVMTTDVENIDVEVEKKTWLGVPEPDKPDSDFLPDQVN